MRDFGLIYCITNTANGKIYVGQTTQKLAVRWKQHVYLSRAETPGMTISYAIKKHGKHCFVVRELAKADSQAELNTLEIFFIAKLYAFGPNGYNMSPGGISGGRMSQETRSKISVSQIGKKHSDETRLKMSRSNSGKNFSTERCVAISNSLKGKLLSDDTRRAISEALKKTHCWRGHALEADNLYVSPKGIRRCKQCIILCREYQKQIRAASA